MAANALKGADRPGVLQLVRIHPADESVLTRRYPIGDVDTMTAHAVMDAEAGFNLYVEGRTVSETASGRGKAADTRGVFAFVSDADADKGKAGSLGVQPSFIVETSPGNEHQWLALDRALTAEQAQPIGAAIRAAAGSDGDTGVITQPYRVAGTPNYPGKRKLARGRVATPTRILEHTGRVWTVDELRAAFPAVEKPSAYSAGPRQTGTSGLTSNRVVRIVAEEGDDRSARFHAAVQAALADGLTIDDLEEVMRQHPTGCAGKYLEPSDRLRREIERSWDKAEAHAAEIRQAADAPAFEDAAQPVALARQAVETRIQAFIEAANAWRLAGDEEAEPPVHAVAVSTGVGKTRITARTLADYIISRRGDRKPAKPILYVVPRHRLGDEIAAQFDGYGITARVFRGREADDPANPGQTMCDDVEAVKIALSLGESVQKACCRSKDTKTGVTHHCPFYSTCSYQAQMRDKPEVWIVAHQMLFQGQTALGKVEMVVVDESFWQTGVRIPHTGLTLDEVAAFLPFGSPKTDSLLNDIESYRRRLSRALRQQEGPGGVQRAHLVEANLTPETCSTAISLEWKLKDKTPIYPGMNPAERRLAARVAAKAKHVRSFVALWKAARDVLNDEEVTVSGRLYLDTRDDPDGRVLVAKARSVKAVAKQWHRPTLLLDATLPPAEILSAFYPQAETAEPIEAAMPHVRVRQVLDAPVSATKLKLDDEGAPRRNLRAVRRTILRRFIDNGRAPLLVIAQKAVAGWLRASGLPNGIGVEHFNNVAGLDQYRDVRGLMVIGRALPQPAAVEALAGALTGRQPAMNEGRYPYAGRGIRTRDGSPRGVECAAHPDPTAEACRWQICEGELMQAIGRARGVNRTADTPLTIDLVANVVLPMTVDEVTPWNPPDEEVEMLIEGVRLDSPSDMSTVWPTIWETPMAAKKWTYRAAAAATHTGPEPYKEGYYIGFRPRVERFRYQQPGPRQKWRTGCYDPAVVPDPRAWLEDRLGPLAKFEIVSAEPALAPAAPLRAANIDPGLASRFRCIVDLPAAPQPTLVKADAVRWRLPSDDEPIRWPPAIADLLAATAPAYREAAE